MKIFKKFICALVIVVLAMTFAGCGEEKPQLATPQNVTVSDDGEITWDAVENAEYYVVVLNGYNYRCDGTSYTVGSVVNDFTYSVIASASGYKSSAPSEVQTFTGKGTPPPPVDPDLEGITVSIKGNQLVGSGKSTKFTATVKFPDGRTNSNVVWSVTEGGEYGSIDGDGKFTAKTVTEDRDVTVRATSTDNDEKYAEIIICVACQPVLTDEMLSSVSDNYIGFEGYMDIELRTFELFDKYVETVQVSGISTQMNGDRWHARYVDNSTNYVADINYKNEGGVAQQVALSLMNDEQYFPMTDDAGKPVSWLDSGLYNNFAKVTADDFEFDEDDWRYYYKGNDATLAQKMVASANPYEFEASSLGLIIEGGELLGIFAESKPSFSVVPGYKAIQRLYSYINCGADNVEVPLITKFEHNPKTTDGGFIDHDALDEAIENMRSLENYTLDFRMSSHMASGYTIGGYVETVIDGDYYFEPYDIISSGGNQIAVARPNAQYGYHKLDANTYNSYNYNADKGVYEAARAFKGDMDKAKASFAFASEIFTSFQAATVDGKDATIYYVDETMCTVASTLYYGVGNDAPLYGLFAMRYEMLADYTPYVVVRDGKILEAGFFYFLGDMYGEVRIYYSDFNSASMPDSFKSFDGYVPRVPPASWADLTVIDETDGGDSGEVNALEFFIGMFGSAEKVNDLPFFGDLLGDTYGFGLATYRQPGGISYSVETVVLYYDVALDADRTINSSIKSAQEFLVENGFVKNAYGEYVKGDVSAMPYDSSLDFWIYVWKTV